MSGLACMCEKSLLTFGERAGCPFRQRGWPSATPTAPG